MIYLVCNPDGQKYVFPNKVVRTTHLNDTNSKFWASEFLFDNQEVIVLTKDIPNVNCNITWDDEPVPINNYSFEELKEYGDTGIELFAYIKN